MLRSDLASCPLKHESVCGDQGGFWQTGSDQYLACLVDGLGHGQQAYRVALRCIEVVTENVNASMQILFQSCNKELQGSRGVAMSVAHIDIKNNTLQYAGVGNVNACLLAKNSDRLVNSYGIIGQQPELKLLIQTRSFLPQQNVLLMYSDGIRDDVDFCRYKSLFTAGLGNLASLILGDAAYGTDDAAIMAVY